MTEERHHLFHESEQALFPTSPTPIASPASLAYTPPMVDKIGYTRPPLNARNVRRTGATSGSGFADALSAAEGAGAAEGMEATAGISATGDLTGLIGLQEVDEREARRRSAVKRGRLTLDALSNLRDALLMGSLPISTIERLERMVEQERAAGVDPALSAVLDEIELRAAVELAKLEMSGAIPPRAEN